MNLKWLALAAIVLLLLGCTQSQNPQNPDDLNSDSNSPGNPDVNVPVDQNQDQNVSLTGFVSVRVVDENQSPVTGALVRLLDANDSQEIAQLVTDQNGFGLFSDFAFLDVNVLVGDQNDSVFESASQQVTVDGNEFVSFVLTEKRWARPPSGSRTTARTVQADDSEFYPLQVQVPKGSILVLTLKVRTFNVAEGGLIFRHPLIGDVYLDANETKTIWFPVNDDVRIESFWPDSNVNKTFLPVYAIPQDWR